MKPAWAFVIRDTIRSVVMLILSTVVGFLFYYLGFSESNIIMVYILGVLIIAVMTHHQTYSLVASASSVLIFNFFFTKPMFSLRAYDKEYPITFLVMFIAAFLTSTLAVRLKQQARESADAAYRTKILLDTSQLLERAADKEEIISVVAQQITKLLKRELVFYEEENGKLLPPRFFYGRDEIKKEGPTPEEKEQAAAWALEYNSHVETAPWSFSDAGYLYFSIRIKERLYGVVGIRVETALDSFEKSILLSILGACALSLENEKNRKEKEEAAILAQKEQLQANLLRSISHDLRTPLTSISGNASNLLNNGKKIDEGTKERLYSDIYDDAMWLINLVENLLSVTRFEEGRIILRVTAELMEEVIEEALCHVSREKRKHHITVTSSEEFILARIDAKLMVQVMINMVDNALKYTPPGSHIDISVEKQDGWVVTQVADDGPGIPEEIKEHIFDMFYSGANKVADSRRSLGLGLFLCKSIILAHGGEIKVMENQPRGTVFWFTVPAGEVDLNE